MNDEYMVYTNMSGYTLLKTRQFARFNALNAPIALLSALYMTNGIVMLQKTNGFTYL